MDLHPSDVAHGMIALAGFYELQLTREIVHLARGGGTMIDVGANAGYFSLLWSGTRAENKAFAFEPVARNLGFLQTNVKANKMADRILIYPVAMGSSAGEAEFDLGPDSNTGWGGFATSETTDDRRMIVPVIRGDDVLPDEEYRVMKIDVEGAEALVLKGCERLLRRGRIGTIYFEQFKPREKALGIGPTDAVDFLRGLGYTVTPFAGGGTDMVEWVAVRRS